MIQAFCMACPNGRAEAVVARFHRGTPIGHGAYCDPCLRFQLIRKEDVVTKLICQFRQTPSSPWCGADGTSYDMGEDGRPKNVRCEMHQETRDTLMKEPTQEGPIPGPNLSSRAFVAEVMEKVFEECRTLRGAGQKEYAHDEGNAFANFEDDATATGISREAVLTIFANKHWRGIRAYVGGHKSQREDVRGRINDMIVYLVLLRAMIEANEA